MSRAKPAVHPIQPGSSFQSAPTQRVRFVGDMPAALLALLLLGYGVGGSALHVASTISWRHSRCGVAVMESDMAYRRRMQQDGGPAPPPRARPPPQTSESVGMSFDGTRQSVNRARAADRYQRQGPATSIGPAEVEASAPEPTAATAATAATTAAAATEAGASEAARAEPAPTSDGPKRSGLDPKLAAIFDGYAEPPGLEDGL